MHFVGIGGAGMSGIAELLVNLGFSVSGSDMKASPITDRLADLGVRFFEGHDASHVGEADVVVYSSAVRSANSELVEARHRQIPVIPRAEMLAELMRARYGIAVAGAHGKTTTTSMIALVLHRAGLDPTAVIGGRLSALGGSARLGRGDCLVAEADESDRSFLTLSPTIAVITNIDREHMEAYGTFERLEDAFVDFGNKVPFYGAVVASADDAPLSRILPRIGRRVITYGLDTSECDVSGTDVRLEPFRAGCRVQLRGKLRIADPANGGDASAALGELWLNVPGRHNLQNALAAIAVGLELGVSFRRLTQALAEFRGAERRFERRGEAGNVLVVDDYGHHPTEIAAVLAAARGGLERRVVVVFQPHRYTRTKQLLGEFGPALAGADEIVLTDIYPAGEDPIPDVTVERLAAAIRDAVAVPVHLVKHLDDVAAAVVTLTRPGDLVITLGAGSIGGVADRILAELQKRGGRRG